VFVAREPREAGRRFLTSLGRVTECVTAQRLFVLPEGYSQPGEISVVAFGPEGDPVRLSAKSGGQSGLMLDVRHWYTVVAAETPDAEPGWRVTTLGYEYRVLDRREREILAYHWDPRTNRGPRYPHLHVSAEATVYRDAETLERLHLDRRHMPTGRVALESVVRLLIAEFGIAYRFRNWSSRLAGTEAAFRNEASQWP
jgi:hypothetical protein